MEKDIRLLTRARDTTRAKKEATLSELQLLNRQVYLREQMLRGMRMQVEELGKEIEKTVNTIRALENEVNSIQETYGRLMIVTYKALQNKSASFYFLSAESVSQGYQRIRYFKAISDMMKSQVKMLRRTKAHLARKKIELEQQKVEKLQVAARERLEREKLVVLKEEQKAMYQALRQNEAQYDREISDTKKALVDLNKEVANEIQRLAALAKKNKTTKELDVINELSDNFSRNKGKFPWPMPMPNATVTRHFGRQSLPGGVMVNLQGIDITTLPGQKVRAVFSGRVEQIMPVMGQGKMVIVSHGSYYTVYANLGEVNVQVGDEIAMLQQVGTARTDPGSGETKIHFQLYKEREPQDPESWLVKKS